jgi:hypothetical protein
MVYNPIFWDSIVGPVQAKFGGFLPDILVIITLPTMPSLVQFGSFSVYTSSVINLCMKYSVLRTSTSITNPSDPVICQADNLKQRGP